MSDRCDGEGWSKYELAIDSVVGEVDWDRGIVKDSDGDRLIRRARDMREDRRQLRKVRSGEFRNIAALAGWSEKTIRLFLKSDCAVHDYVPVGKYFLRVIDWPKVTKVLKGTAN